MNQEREKPEGIDVLGYPITKIEDGKVLVTPFQYHTILVNVVYESGFGWLPLKPEQRKLVDSLVIIPKPEVHPDGEVISGNFNLTPKDIINAIFPKTNKK